MVSVDRRAELEITSERPRRIPQDVIDRIVELSPSAPNYPLKRPFEVYYQAFTPGPGAPLIGKYYVAVSLIEDGRYKGSKSNGEHKGLQFLVDKFIPQGYEKDLEALELKKNLQIMLTAIRVQQGEIGYFSPESEQAKSQLDEDLGKNQKMQELAFGGVPIEILGLIETIDRFSDITDQEKLEELRSWTTPSMLRWYLGVLKGKTHRSELSPVEVLDRLPKKVFKNQQALKVNLLDGYYEEKIWDQINVSGRATGLAIWEKMIATVADPEEKAFIEGVYQKVCDIVNTPQREGFKEKILVKEKEREFPSPEQQTFDYYFHHYGTRLLRGETGVGKTATAFYVMEGTKATGVLVFTPASGRETFSLEEKAVFEHPGKVFVIKGSRDIERAIKSGKKYIVVGQELLSRAENDHQLNSKLEELVLTMKINGGILDEIHNFSNPDIYATKIARRLIGLIRGNYQQMTGEDDAPIIGLTATPIKRDISTLNVPMAMLYPHQYAATPGEATESRKTFSDTYLNRPDLAHVALIIGRRMFNWGHAQGVQPFEYKTIPIEVSPFEQLLYEFIGTEIPTNVLSKIILLEDVPLDPDLVKVEVRNLANGKIPEIDLDEATETLKKVVKGWKELKAINVPISDEDFLDIDKLVELGFGDLVLSCFFSGALEKGVDTLVEEMTKGTENPDLTELRTFWRAKDLSSKYQTLRSSIREDLTWKVGEDGVLYRNRVIIVSPGKVQGRTGDVLQRQTLEGENLYLPYELDSINDATLARLLAVWTEDLIDPDGIIIIDGNTPIGRRRNAKIARWVNTDVAMLFANLPAVYQSRDFTINRIFDDLGRRIAGISQYFLHHTWYYEKLKQMAGRSQRQGQLLEVDTGILEAQGLVDEGKGEFVQFTEFLTRIAFSGLRLAPELVEFIESKNAVRKRIRLQGAEARFLRDVFNTVRGAGEEAIDAFLKSKVAGEERTYYQKLAERYFDEGRDEYRTSGYNAEFVASLIQHLDLTEGQLLSLGAGTLLLQRKLRKGIDNVDMNPFMMEAGWSIAREYGGRMIPLRISQLDNSVVSDSAYDGIDYSFAIQWSNLGESMENSERLAFLRIVHSKLKPGAKFILTVPDSVFDDEKFQNFINGLESTHAFVVDRTLSGKTFGVSQLGSTKRLGWCIVAEKTGIFDLADVRLSDFEFLHENGEWISLGPKEKIHPLVVKTGDYPAPILRIKFAGYEIINTDNSITTLTPDQKKPTTEDSVTTKNSNQGNGKKSSVVLTQQPSKTNNSDHSPDYGLDRQDLINYFIDLGMSLQEAEELSLSTLQRWVIKAGSQKK